MIAEAAFRFRLRIPLWATNTATISLNNATPTPATADVDGFHILSLPKGVSSVTLTLPMDVRIEEEQAGGVSVHAGALLFALDLNPVEHNTGGCFYPPEGCEEWDTSRDTA